jgi:hypothetical protein
MIVANLTLIFLFTFGSAFVTRAGSTQANPYNSLFYGVLAFSSNPSAHLRDLGMDDATQCVNTSAFSSVGPDCLIKYQNQMSFQNTMRVIYREPVVIFRMLRYALNNMQDVSLDYLGKYSFYDPRSKTSPRVPTGTTGERFWSSTAETIPLNLWARLKFKFFPIGYALAFTLIGFGIWFIWGLISTGINQDLALIGLMSTVACVAHMFTAILGDGKAELIKHLFLSNILFDIAAVVFLNSVLITCIELTRKKLSWLNSQKPTAVYRLTSVSTTKGVPTGCSAMLREGGRGN